MDGCGEVWMIMERCGGYGEMFMIVEVYAWLWKVWGCCSGDSVRFILWL